MHWLRRLGAVGYLGETDSGNLGDEAMYLAFRRIFRYAANAWPLHWAQRVHRKLVGSERFFRFLCVGGGTLLFREVPSVVPDCVTHSIPLYTFGTGVRDPEFWRSLPPTKVLRGEGAVVRGFHSQSILAAYGVASKVVGDPALLLSGGAPVAPPRQRVLGINIGHSFGRVWGGDDSLYLERVACMAELLISRGWRFRLFSVWHGDDETVRELARRLRTSVISCHAVHRDPFAYMRLVATCDVLVGMKLHAVVLAYCQSVPSIMLEYRPKCRDFMATMGAETRCFRCDQVEAQDLAEAVESCYASADSIRDEERKSVQHWNRALRALAREIAIAERCEWRCTARDV
jgi:hypothetical protein